MIRYVSFFVRPFAVLLVIVTGACSESSGPTAAAPTEASSALLLNESGAAIHLETLARFQGPRATGATVRQGWIGPEGGRLELRDFAIEVPPGAVTRTTRFSIRLPADPRGAERVVAVFGPHNSTFLRPVTIEFPLAGTSIAGSESASVVWWNAGSWVDMGGVVTDDGARISTTTEHFSTYGTTDPGRGGGTLVSGG